MGTQGNQREKRTHTTTNNPIETPESQKKQPIHNTIPPLQSIQQNPNYPSNPISKKNPNPPIVMGIPISISIKKGYLQENINISSKR